MFSLYDLYRISAQLCKALNAPDLSFGGLGVIVAGDFAQLPPVGKGNLPLYSDTIGPYTEGTTLRSQQNAMGKVLWYSFTTVVILRENMRLRSMSLDDVAYRRALANMRFKSCTKEDIQLLQTRVASVHDKSKSLENPRFANVSIITAHNAQRDAINNIATARFAEQNGVKVSNFYSIDQWDHAPLARVASDMSTDEDTSVKSRIQHLLWSLPPALTENRAGILPLCRGMPVLLKANKVTEISATNGAEAKVVDWQSHVGTSSGCAHLDVVFVELTAPPQTCEVPGLPTNVIPVTMHKDRIACTLPSDGTMRISRSQVQLLPNFAMTDYASQGRTRHNNVVHLEHCKGFLSIYTCLSRSSSLEGTLILGRLDPAKITGGLSGALRREF
ncbi:hypothetical protein BDW22DRAFT_1298315, partial [Trametopsis cervina]